MSKSRKITNVTVAKVGQFGSVKRAKTSGGTAVKKASPSSEKTAAPGGSGSSVVERSAPKETRNVLGFGKATFDEVAVETEHLELSEGEALSLNLPGANALVFVVEDNMGDVTLDDFFSFVSLRRARADRREEIITSYLSLTVPSDGESKQIHRNAEERLRFLESVGYYTSEEVAERSGSRAANKAQFASRLKNEGKVFAVSFRGQSLFPAFQFDSDFKPKPVISRTVHALTDRGLRGWELAFWFAGNSSFLGGKRPLDILDVEPELAVTAASREAPW